MKKNKEKWESPTFNKTCTCMIHPPTFFNFLDFPHKKNWSRPFSIYVSFLRYFIFSRIVPPFFIHRERRYSKQLMREKESLNFLTQFYNHLWLLPRHFPPFSKNIDYWIWSLFKFKLDNFLTKFTRKTGHFEWIFWVQFLLT